jgi:hypothetical protein
LILLASAAFEDNDAVAFKDRHSGRAHDVRVETDVPHQGLREREKDRSNMLGGFGRRFAKQQGKLDLATDLVPIEGLDRSAQLGDHDVLMRV